MVTASTPLVLSILPPLPLAVGTQAVSWFAAGPLNPILSAVQYECIPPRMRGRVFGALTAGAFTAMPLGVLVAGYLVDGMGLRPTLLGTGGLYLATALSLLVNPAIRGMDRPRAAGNTSSAPVSSELGPPAQPASRSDTFGD